MDAASAALFEALARELESSSWVVLVTRRDAPGGLDLPSGAQRPDRARSAAARGRARRSRWPRRRRRSCRRTSSSSPSSGPGAARSSCSTCSRRPRPAIATELPDSVDAATMARIDALDPEDARPVRRAAVLGLSFHPRRLRGRDRAGRAGARRSRLGAAVGGVRPRAGRPRALPPAGTAGGGLLEPAVQAAARAAPSGRRSGSSGADGTTGRRCRRAVEPLRAGRRPRAGASLRDARRRARDRALLARRRGAALPAGDRGRTALGLAADGRALAEAWEHLGEALRSRRRAGGGEPGPDRGAPAGAATTRSPRPGCATARRRWPSGARR